MIKIDKGIPVPKKAASGKIYPVADLDVGDSFFAPNVKQNRITGSIYPVSVTTGRKFTVRTVTENGVTGVRVWRIK